MILTHSIDELAHYAGGTWYVGFAVDPWQPNKVEDSLMGLSGRGGILKGFTSIAGLVNIIYYLSAD
jgi:hypothetical protein